MTQPFTLGVNYWPRRKAMYWWSDFDPGEVREEFAMIRGLGLSLVRLFLLWDDFQPTPDSVSPDCLAHLTTVCDIAAENGLKLNVTFFTGHMSGPNWAPAWLCDPSVPPHVRMLMSGGKVVTTGYRNPFSDPVALGAERLLLRTVVGALRQHPGVGLWNLGNEPDLFAVPANAEAGRAWTREMVELIKSIDDQHPVTCGLHIDSLHRENGLRLDQVFAETDVAVMHAYPMYVDWGRSPLDPDLVPFTCALTTALCGKPTLMEEFGGCTAPPGHPSYVMDWNSYGKPRSQFMASEEEMAAYIEAVLPRLVEVGATGALVWCFADYATDLWDKPPCSESQHERFFGLVRPDGTLKPHAQVMKRFAETKPMVLSQPVRTVETVSADIYYADPRKRLVQLYHAYTGA